MENIKKKQIKKLIKEHCELEDGFYIEQYLNLISVCDEPNVYISRRSLKHFVERRKGELLKNNSFNKTIDMLISMILYIENVVKDSDSVITKELENKIIYEKSYDKETNLSIRVITEIIENHQDIKSLHFIKIKKPP